MDILGKVARDYLKKLHEGNVKQAYTLAKDFKKDGMSFDDIEEMLYASGYESDVIQDALDQLGGK